MISLKYLLLLEKRKNLISSISHKIKFIIIGMSSTYASKSQPPHFLLPAPVYHYYIPPFTIFTHWLFSFLRMILFFFLFLFLCQIINQMLSNEAEKVSAPRTKYIYMCPMYLCHWGVPFDFKVIQKSFCTLFTYTEKLGEVILLNYI